MARPMIHDSDAARQAAHRKRETQRGRKRIEITLRTTTIVRLKAEAKERGLSLSDTVEILLADSR